MRGGFGLRELIWGRAGRARVRLAPKRPGGWGSPRGTCGGSVRLSAGATAAPRWCGSAASSHWTPSPRTPAGWRSPPTVAW